MINIMTAIAPAVATLAAIDAARGRRPDMTMNIKEDMGTEIVSRKIINYARRHRATSTRIIAHVRTHKISTLILSLRLCATLNTKHDQQLQRLVEGARGKSERIVHSGNKTFSWSIISTLS